MQQRHTQSSKMIASKHIISSYYVMSHHATWGHEIHDHANFQMLLSRTRFSAHVRHFPSVFRIWIFSTSISINWSKFKSGAVSLWTIVKLVLFRIGMIACCKCNFLIGYDLICFYDMYRITLYVLWLQMYFDSDMNLIQKETSRSSWATSEKDIKWITILCILLLGTWIKRLTISTYIMYSLKRESFVLKRRIFVPTFICKHIGRSRVFQRFELASAFEVVVSSIPISIYRGN